MKPGFIFAGKLRRNTILPAYGSPVIDIPGGDLLYAAAGLLLWEEKAGLLSRVGENYPHDWLQRIAKVGMDTTGIKVLPESMDLRNLMAYNENSEPIQANPVSIFAKRGIPFPKTLSGYQSTPSIEINGTEGDPSSPRPEDIPSVYKKFQNIHLCEMEFPTITRFISAFREAGTRTLTVEPANEWMQPEKWYEISLLLNGISAFLPSKESLSSLFKNKTTDVIEMVGAISNENCEVVVVKSGVKGQLVHDARSKKSWQVPAYPVKIIDPTGAGAAFCGGFLAGLAQSGDPLQASLMGNISASITLEGSGIFHILEAQPGLAQARLASLKEEVRQI
ncbi:carbohydrate kinase family protein [Chloroflexota bacterium]